MLPKNYRIVKAKDIKQTLKSRFRANSQYCQLILNKSEINHFRLLVIVSKKIHKKANQRNRLRRRIIAIFSQLLQEDRLPAGIDCIVQVKSKDVLILGPQIISLDIIPKLRYLYNTLEKNAFNQKKRLSEPFKDQNKTTKILQSV